MNFANTSHLIVKQVVNEMTPEVNSGRY